MSGQSPSVYFLQRTHGWLDNLSPGWWLVPYPSEKYAGQNGFIFPKVNWVNWVNSPKIFKLPPLRGIFTEFVHLQFFKPQQPEQGRNPWKPSKFLTSLVGWTTQCHSWEAFPFLGFKMVCFKFWGWHMFRVFCWWFQGGVSVDLIFTNMSLGKDHPTWRIIPLVSEKYLWLVCVP